MKLRLPDVKVGFDARRCVVSHASRRQHVLPSALNTFRRKLTFPAPAGDREKYALRRSFREIEEQPNSTLSADHRRVDAWLPHMMQRHTNSRSLSREHGWKVSGERYECLGRHRVDAVGFHQQSNLWRHRHSPRAFEKMKMRVSEIKDGATCRLVPPR